MPGLYPILALACAALASGLTLPLWRRLCLRVGLVDSPGQRKIHAEPTPLAGGFALLTGTLLPLMAAWVWVNLGTAPPPLAHAHLPAGVIVGTLGMTLVGALDDYWPLRPANKFLAQLLVGLLAVGTGVQTHAFDLPPGVAPALSLLWILTVVNATNFIDNMNGLCAGLGAIAACALGVTTHTGGQTELAAVAFVTAGAALGFLPWNFPRAKAFLGDTGSHATGFLVAAMSLLTDFGAGRKGQMLAPLMILAVPLADLAWVVLVRTCAGRPFYVGDTNHLSHQLVRLGCSRAQAVAILWAAAVALAGMTFLL